jgi:hypothetical protein
MLSEIFILRLETASRVLPKTLPSSSSQFVPFDRSSQFAFKYQKDWLVEPAPNSLNLEKDFWWTPAAYIDPGEA